jgi:hypothetical protein
VRRVDGTSRNTQRLAGVAEAFQVSENSVEPQRVRNKTRHILAKHPSRPSSGNKSAHFRPEIAVVVSSALLSGDRPGLAWEASADEVSRSNCIGAQLPHVVEDRHVGPVLAQHALAERIALAERHGRREAGPLQPESKAANAAEQVQGQHQAAPVRFVAPGQPTASTTCSAGLATTPLRGAG